MFIIEVKRIFFLSNQEFFTSTYHFLIHEWYRIGIKTVPCFLWMGETCLKKRA